MGEPRSIPQLATAIRALDKRGLVKTIDDGPQGVGTTLDAALNVKSNGSGTKQHPDLGIGVKIKAQQGGSNNRMTLFTKSPDTTGNDITRGELLRKFGDRPDDPDAAEHDITLYKNPASPSNDFEIDIAQGKLYVITPHGGVYGTYSMVDLRENFRDRFKYLMISTAQKASSYEGDTLYRYKSADLYYDMDLDLWEEAILNGDVIIEFRMACNEGEYSSPRDRGVAWRMYIEDLIEIYAESADLLDDSLDIMELPRTPQTTLREPDHHSFEIFESHER